MIEDNLKHKILRNLIDALDDTSYPLEEIREDFIEDIREAEKEIVKDKRKRYSIDSFKENFSGVFDY